MDGASDNLSLFTIIHLDRIVSKAMLKKYIYWEVQIVGRMLKALLLTEYFTLPFH